MRKLRTFCKQFFLIDDTPHKIAAGAALGIFLGIAPGEGVMATLILASLFRFNRFSATVGVALTNMWMTVAILPLAAAVGGFLFNASSTQLIRDFDASYRSGMAFFFSRVVWVDVAVPLLVGFFVVAGCIAVAAYVLLYVLLKRRKIEKE